MEFSSKVVRLNFEFLIKKKIVGIEKWFQSVFELWMNGIKRLLLSCMHGSSNEIIVEIIIIKIN